MSDDNRVIAHRTEHLPCQLSDEELREAGDDLVSLLEDIAAEEQRAVDLRTRVRARMAELEARRSQLAIMIRRREEHRDVEVEVVSDYDAGTVTRTRTDTGEVISSRTLSDEERQRGLPGVAGRAILD